MPLHGLGSSITTVNTLLCAIEELLFAFEDIKSAKTLNLAL